MRLSFFEGRKLAMPTLTLSSAPESSISKTSRQEIGGTSQKIRKLGRKLSAAAISSQRWIIIMQERRCERAWARWEMRMRSLILSISLSQSNLKYMPKLSKKWAKRTKGASTCPICIITTHLQPLHTSHTTRWLIKTPLSAIHFNRPRRKWSTPENPPLRLPSQAMPPVPCLQSKRDNFKILEVLSTPLKGLSSITTSERFFPSRHSLPRIPQGNSRRSS